MTFKIYNKSGEYITTIGIMRNMEYKKAIELIKTLIPQYADCVFKKIKKKESQHSKNLIIE